MRMWHVHVHAHVHVHGVCMGVAGAWRGRMCMCIACAWAWAGAHSLRKISAACGGGVSSFLLYLEPCRGLSRMNAMRTWGDR